MRRSCDFPKVAALLAAALLLLTGIGSRQIHGAEPEKMDLFKAGEGGYAMYRIPGLVVTAKGTVLAYCEARKSSGSDWGQIDVFLRRSTDGGRTWDAPRQIAHFGERIAKNPVAVAKNYNLNEQTVNNPTAIASRDGVVHFLYCGEYARCFYMRSDDDGVTFSKPVDITAAFDKFKSQYDWKVLATGPAHGIQLASGRLVVPIWLSLGTGAGAHRPSVNGTIYSDDGGKTWRGGEIAIADTADTVNPNETVVVELADGRVMLNARSESKANRRLVTISPDGVGNWSKARFDAALMEPICMGSIVRFSKTPEADRNRILFCNPHALARDASGKDHPGKSGPRKNLSIKLSYDEGQTWPVDKTLEPGPSAYSDLAVLSDGTILCFYERGADARRPYALLTLARFDLQWLTDGKDAFAPKSPK